MKKSLKLRLNAMNTDPDGLSDALGAGSVKVKLCQRQDFGE